MRKIYVCCSLSGNTEERVSAILDRHTDAHDRVLRPTKSQLSDRDNAVEADVAWIKHCDEVWVIGYYGRDCSWEIGYAMGIGKPVTIFLDEANRELFDGDWMLRHGYSLGLLKLRMGA